MCFLGLREKIRDGVVLMAGQLINTVFGLRKKGGKGRKEREIIGFFTFPPIINIVIKFSLSHKLIEKT